MEYIIIAVQKYVFIIYLLGVKRVLSLVLQNFWTNLFGRINNRRHDTI